MAPSGIFAELAVLCISLLIVLIVVWRYQSHQNIANNPWIALMKRSDVEQPKEMSKAANQTQQSPTASPNRVLPDLNEENNRKSELMLAAHHDLIDRFLEITERKVSALDDYGDEQWDALPSEIERCLAKIAKREQATYRYKWPTQGLGKGIPRHVRGTLIPFINPYRDEYVFLSAALDAEFRAHHDARRSARGRLQDFGQLTGVDFENYVANLLRDSGYSVSGTPVTGDQGADLIAKKRGKTIAIQAKRWTGAVGNSAIQEIVAALKFYNANEGWVVTNSTFTPSARQLAQINNIRLIDGHDLKNGWVSPL